MTTPAPPDARQRAAAAARQRARTEIVEYIPTQTGGTGPKISTGAGEAPVIPLLMIAIGGYLLWFGVKYWRGSGPAVWPSYVIKSVLQGKGVPPNIPAGTAETQLTAFETTQAAAIAQSGTGSQTSKPTPPGPGGPGPPSNASETLIIGGILSGIGAPHTQANINSMSAWIAKETPWPPVAKFNPMNTTLPMPGSTCFNSVCVRNYTSWSQGIAATVATLQGYPGIVAGFRAGLGVCGGGFAAEFLRWSGGGYSSVC